MKPRTRVWSRLAQCALLLLGTTAPANAQGAAGRHVAIAGAGAAEAARIGFVLAESPFARQQLQHTRVRSAQRTAGPRILRAFAEKNILHPAAEIYVRAFKSERILELWVRPQDATRFRLLKTYEICALAGDPGPKRRQGRVLQHRPVQSAERVPSVAAHQLPEPARPDREPRQAHGR
jgi:hypothetical protein